MANFMFQIRNGKEITDVCMFKASSIEKGVENKQVQYFLNRYDDSTVVTILEIISNKLFEEFYKGFKSFRFKDLKIIYEDEE